MGAPVLFQPVNEFECLDQVGRGIHLWLGTGILPDPRNVDQAHHHDQQSERDVLAVFGKELTLVLEPGNLSLHSCQRGGFHGLSPLGKSCKKPTAWPSSTDFTSKQRRLPRCRAGFAGVEARAARVFIALMSAK
jgi:hypothetical protein